MPAHQHSTIPRAEPVRGPHRLRRRLSILAGRTARALWPTDAALLELRWAAVTATLMASLIVFAHLSGGADARFERAAPVMVLAAAVFTLLASGSVGRTIARWRQIRLVLGPAIVLTALLAAELPPPDTMAPSPATPLIILALTFAALGRGFVPAAGLVAGASTIALWAHAIEPGHAVVDDHSIAFLVRVVVSLAAATGMHVVVRQLNREQERSELLARRQQARLREFEGLHRILARFDGSAPLTDVLPAVVADMSSIYGLPHVTIYLVEPDGWLSLAGQVDYDVPIYRLPPGTGVMGRAIRSRETQWLTDVTNDPDYVPGDAAVTSELAVPLVHADEVLGVLNIEGTRDRPVTDEDVAVAEMVGKALATTVRVARLGESRDREVDRLVGLHEILNRFDGVRPVANVLQDVVGDVAARFGIALVSLYLPDDAGRLEMVGVAGYEGTEHVIDDGRGIIGRAARLRETQYVPDVALDPDYVSARSDIRSEVAVPILHDGELLGVVNFEGTETQPIRAEHVAIAEMLGRSIAAAIRTARLDEERRQRLESIERLLAVTRELNADLDRSRVIATVCNAAREFLAADIVSFAAGSPADGYRIEHVAGTNLPLAGRIVIPGQGLAGRAISGRSRLLSEVGVDEWPTGLGTRRPGDVAPHLGLALPIEIDGDVTGVLVLTRFDADHRFGELELRLADLLTAQVAISLRNAQLHAQVAEAAVRDPLTGLLNRRFLDPALEHEFAASRRASTPLSVIVLDLDRFSDVNNEHGHLVGDEVLRRVATTLRHHVRDADVLARYGGEEFVIVAPGATSDVALRVAERIREAVARLSDQPIEGIAVKIAVSAGVATMIGNERDAAELIRAADSALLAAKRAGRNRVVSI